MAYSKIRQPKLSDVIEQQLEFLILEGTLRPAKNSHQNANWRNSSTYHVLHSGRPFSVSKPKGYCFVARGAGHLFKAHCGRASATRWLSS
ncbi:pyruvate dehydrogenase complex repressor [Atlantibacter hermannii]|nr:pyruvate dehydrogenase complex repressor [Atlantibacter hermannii]